MRSGEQAKGMRLTSGEDAGAGDGPARFEAARSEGRDHAAQADLDALWREHRRWVAAVLLAHMPRDAELDDLLQEVAMLMVRSIHTLNDPAAIRPWLRTIAVNTARSAARKRTSRLRLFRQSENLESAPEQVEHADEMTRFAEDDRGKRLMKAACALPVAYREPLILRCVRGLSQRAVAQALELPETTIETRLVRARRMLREQMEMEERRAEEKRKR